MKKAYLLFLIFLTTSLDIIFAQIDTTVYYPIEIGYYWQYKEQIPSGEFLTHYIATDTSIYNQSYFKLIITSNFGTNVRYIRAEGNHNEKIFYYNQFCDNNEGLLYDFTTPDSAIWISCHPSIPFTSSFFTHYRYLDFMNQTFKTHTFVDAFIDSSITPPDTTYGMLYEEKYSHGIGMVEWSGEQAPHYFLEGMILNDVHYGNTSLFVGLEEDIQSISRFSLKQNYPNPFNPNTKISYELPIDAFVELTIYNAIGEKVETLVNQFEPKGKKKLNFNGENLSAGLYIYILRANNFTQVKKMILLK